MESCLRWLLGVGSKDIFRVDPVDTKKFVATAIKALEDKEHHDAQEEAVDGPPQADAARSEAAPGPPSSSSSSGRAGEASSSAACQSSSASTSTKPKGSPAGDGALYVAHIGEVTIALAMAAFGRCTHLGTRHVSKVRLCSRQAGFRTPERGGGSCRRYSP